MTTAVLPSTNSMETLHNVTTAVLPSTNSMETLSSGHFMYTIGHPISLGPWTTNLKNTVVVCFVRCGAHW